MNRQKQNPATSNEPLKRSSRLMKYRETEKLANNLQSQLDWETLHLTNIDTFFPELVWECITNKLKTPDDIENCSNSGPFFNKLLKSKRETEVVLPKVFEILVEKYALFEDSSYKETNLESIPWNRPEGQPIHPLTGIWKCRLVNKPWMKAIDDVFQQENVGSLINMEHITSGSWTLLFKNEHLLNYAQCAFVKIQPDDFINHFKTTHYDVKAKSVIKNPFIGRNVFFNLLDPRDVELEYQTSILEVLEKWGREIWYCTINHNCVGIAVDEVEFYRIFRQSLIWMPNLRSLIVARDKFPEPDYTNLRREIGENPLPALPNLTHLKTFNLRGPIYDHLLSVNNIPKGNICPGHCTCP